jgi:ubiquinol-cytochrome c reductase cytochrome c subunit
MPRLTWFWIACAAWAQTPSVQNGKRLFEVKACYQCHGWVGQGGLAGPRLAQSRLNLAGFRNVLRNPPPSQMPPYRTAVLSDAEAADLFAFIQSLPPPPAVESLPRLME